MLRTFYPKMVQVSAKPGVCKNLIGVNIAARIYTGFGVIATPRDLQCKEGWQRMKYFSHEHKFCLLEVSPHGLICFEDITLDLVTNAFVF